MTDEKMKIEEPDDFMTIDRKPVPLAFCAHPNPIITENVKNEDGIVDQLLELVDPISVGNPNQTRRAPSLKSYGGDTESEFEFSGEDSDFENINDLRSGALDSDEEFDRLVKFSAKIIEKTHKSEYPDENDLKKHRKSKKSQKTANVHEYDDMPPLENLSIECRSNLTEFGFVSKVVDCQVIIVSTCNEVLDFDSYLFDGKGNSVGQVYDIFGQVKSPQYVIRFNSSEEASLIPIDMKVFYAPTEEQFSKTPFKGLNLAAANREAIKSMNRRLDHQNALAKASDRIQDVNVDSDVEFSDDEAERAYRQNMNVHTANSRPGFETNRGGRKRNRGGQRVRFSADNSASKPYRRDNASQFCGPAPAPSSAPSIFSAPVPFSSPAPVSAPTPSAPATSEPAPSTRPPQSTDSNPYAEFGCHSGFNGRFGI